MNVHPRWRRATAALTALGVAGVAVVLGAPSPAGAGVTTVSNTTPIVIPSSGNADPYPSGITVAGLGPSITDLTVTLHDVEHTCVKDLDILLVGPTGTTTTLLSDVGAPAVDLCLLEGGDIDASIVISDTGPSFGTSVPAGDPITVRPSDNDALGHGADSWPGVGDEFPASNLATFDGSNPNGTWNLYVVDDGLLDDGSIGGWSLTITTPNAAPTATNQAVDAHKGEPLAIALGGTDPDGDALTCAPTTGATAKGAVTGSGCSATYTAGARTQGSDSFGFRVSDTSSVQSGQGTISISIVNRNPVASTPAVNVTAGGTVPVVLGGVDADPGESLALVCAPELGETGSGKGRVIGSGCNVTYRADADATGTDTFGFTVADGFGGLANGTVTVTIGASALPGCEVGDTQVQRYVCRVYLDMLGRPAESAGKAYWVNRIQTGKPRYEILNSFSRTEEYRVRATRRIFQELLGRDASSVERTYWAEQLRTKNPDAVRAGIAGSSEFLNRAGGIDGWAPALYQQLLRRPATIQEAAAAKAAVAGGQSRTSFAAALLGSPEADTVTVQSVYEGYLRRTPPTSETSFWVGRLQSGTFETRMVVEIVAAPEYFDKS